MKNLKNEILCEDCGENLLDVGLIDSGYIDLKYSGDNHFKKGGFDFSFSPIKCGGCGAEINEETKDEILEFYPSDSDLNFKDITKSSLCFDDFIYTQQFCPHCGIDIKKRGLHYYAILYLFDYDSSKCKFTISQVDRVIDEALTCGNCGEDLLEYTTIKNAKERTYIGAIYEIPLPHCTF